MGDDTERHADPPSRTYLLERRTLSRGSLSGQHVYRAIDPDGALVCEGTVTGRFLAQPATFRSGTGTDLFTLGSSRRLAPKHWSMTDQLGVELAGFTVERLGRGRCTVRLLDGRALRFEPGDRYLTDLMRAVVLADRDTFQLTDGQDLLAHTGTFDGGTRDLRGALGRLRRAPGAIRAAIAGDEFTPSGRIEVLSHPTPGDDRLIAALMIIHREVLIQTRTP